MANSELEEVFLSSGLQQAASQERPGSKELSRELPGLSGAGRGRRRGEMELLEGQELAGSLVNAGCSCLQLCLLVPPSIVKLLCFIAERGGAGRRSVV